ncbi:TetR/AcrR family transcriptional regulator [Marinilabiliaceae bacterium JC017]|nr:TetR/AcrR family transcriptional regulator [Marinilabiliaceae bacterium JC017]
MNKKDLIFKGAMELFVEQGFTASVNELINRINIAKGTLYHHIDSKEQLIVDIYKNLMFEIERVCVNEFNEDDPKEYNKQVFGEIVKWFISNPAKFHYIRLFETSPYVRNQVGRVEETLLGPRKNIMQKLNLGILKAYSPDLIKYFDFAFTRSMADYFLSLENPLQCFEQGFAQAFDLYWDGVALKRNE